MYTPKAFQCDDRDQMFTLIKDHPLATLICNTDAGLEANHLPMLFEQINGRDMLIGHIAKANPLHKHLSNGSDVLVTFQGSQAYISASHYPTKQRDARVVPTWNYSAVHIKGRIEFTNDKKDLLSIVEALTHAQEHQREHPWKVSDAPQEYIDQMLKAIVGLRISIDDIQGKWKVSQNHTAENRQGVVSALRQEGNDDMATEVEQGA